MKTFLVPSLAAVLASFPALTGMADITGVPGGTAAPPTSLGPFAVTAFPDDARPNFNLVGDVPSPLGGNVSFSTDLLHVEVGDGWQSWSHGYTGDVYYELNQATSLTLDLPP